MGVGGGRLNTAHDISSVVVFGPVVAAVDGGGNDHDEEVGEPTDVVGAAVVGRRSVAPVLPRVRFDAEAFRLSLSSSFSFSSSASLSAPSEDVPSRGDRVRFPLTTQRAVAASSPYPSP